MFITRVYFVISVTEKLRFPHLVTSLQTSFPLTLNGIQQETTWEFTTEEIIEEKAIEIKIAKGQQENKAKRTKSKPQPCQEF